MRARLDTVYRFGGPPGTEEGGEIWVPATLDAVAALRARLGAALARQRWSTEAIGRVALATTEALANAVEHGSAADGRIGFAFGVTGDAAWVRVTDEGRPDAAVPVGAPSEPALDSENGRGRLLMRALSEGFLTRPVGEGTQVTLEFFRLGSFPL